MDDLDKFLEEQALPVKATGTSTTISAASIENDDDFLAFLDEPSTTSIPATGSAIKGDKPISTTDTDDFLDWLNDSPPKNKEDTTPHDAVDTTDADHSASFIEASKSLHKEFKDTSKESMDNFFNDVFGSPEQSTKSGKHKCRIDEQGDEDSDICYEDKIKNIVESTFPDIQKLRRLVYEAGHVPMAQRAQVWSLVLNESSAGDEEARHFSAAGVEFEGQQALASDCSAVITSSGLQLSADETEQMRTDLQDLLVLYCQRRNVPYRAVLCRLLSPLLVVPEPASRLQASSAFYTLASSFTPLINLNTLAYSLGASVVHSCLRLLLVYHCPELVLHLDRVLPHWEEPTAEVSAHQSVKNAAEHKRNSELDELEKELGLDVLDDAVSPGPASSSAEGKITGAPIESALPAREAAMQQRGGGNSDGAGNSASSRALSGRGCLSTHWIVGLFTGSLPPTQSAMLLDWAVMSSCPYAGVYFTATLLIIYSQALLKMPGARIRQWLDEAGMGKADWYRSLSVSVPAAVAQTAGSGVSEAKFIPDDWTAFVKGWINCVTALYRSTPQAFKDSLDRTAEWAQLKAEQRLSGRAVRSRGLDAAQHGSSSGTGRGDNCSNNTSSSNLQARAGAENASDSQTGGTDGGEDSADECEADETVFDSPGADAGAGNKMNLMAQFRRLSLHFQNENTAVMPTDEQSPMITLSGYAQEKIFNGHFSSPICLTANVEEVVPCICSNRRRATAPEDLVQCFYAAAFSQQISSVASVFPPEGLANQVFYFGIDCRSPAERALGQFPKAYAFDPAGLAEPEEVAKLLDMVETMASSAHLCLIGAGEDFLRWSHEQAAPRRFSSKKTGRTDPPELLQAFEESNAKLNAVAMFFLKRSFKHVSILNGGFITAAQYLQQPDSPLSLTAALVDCDRAALESLLGIQPSAAALPSQTAKRDSIVSYLTETTVSAPSKLLSVGNYFGQKSTSTDPTGASTSSVKPLIAPTATDVSTKAISCDATVPPTPPASAAAEENGAKQLLSSWGKKLSMFSTSSLESLKKGVSGLSSTDTAPSVLSTPAVAVEEEEADDGMGPREIADTTKISISRTEKEREQALSMHKMAGLRKGDVVMINRQDLPGAVLFPSIKYKEVWVEAPTAAPISSSDSTGPEGGPSLGQDADKKMAEADGLVGSAQEGEKTPSQAPTADTQIAKVAQQVQVHRYLVVSRERFLVLDASGGGVGSQAVVKSNRHLTELMKMTFKKKDPELVTLYFVAPDLPAGKARQYRVSKRQEFVTALQKNMERFK